MKTRRFCSFLIAIALALISAVGAPARAAESPSRAEILVAFNERLTEAADVLFLSAGGFDGASALPSSALDRLSRRWGVRAVKPLHVGLARLGERESGVSALERRREAWRKLALRAARRWAPGRVDVESLAGLPDPVPVYVLTITSDPAEACRAWAADPHVAFCQPNGRMSLQWIPNDPYFHSSGSWGQPYADLWALQPDRLDLPAALELADGEGVVVAVIDSGVDRNHPDLAANLWSNAEEIPGNFVDDDGNGFVDDHLGWDFVAADGDPLDTHGHGTHVAGTIAALGNNGLGIVGVAPAARIMALDVFDDDGFGNNANIAEAILYAAANGADIFNGSWSCFFQCPENPVLEQAVTIAHGLGTLAVLAAGNGSEDVAHYSPQNMTLPVVVAASRPDDEPAEFSNFGANVDVAAPGAGLPAGPPEHEPERGILSLKSGTASPAATGGGALIVGGIYLRQAGTSMACPHAVGVAALVRSRHPGLSNTQVRQVLSAASERWTNLNHSERYGPGRLHAARAAAIILVPNVAVAAPVPESWYHDPTLEEVEIRGTAGGPGFVSYQLHYSVPGGERWTALGPALTTAVANGRLGALPVAQLPNSRYLIRLTVTTSEGFEFIETTSLFWERRLTLGSHPTSEKRFPSISGQRVVFHDFRNGEADVFVLDLESGLEQQLSDHPTCQQNPRIQGDWVVWLDQRYSGGTFCDNNDPHGGIPNTPTSGAYGDIQLLNLATAAELRVTPPESRNLGRPAVYDGRVVWMDHRHGSLDVFLYDAGTATETRLTSLATEERDPDIWGQKVVWIDTRHGHEEIYLYDLETETEQRLTNFVSPKWAPRIAGDRVIWNELRAGETQLRLHDLATSAETPLAAEPLRLGDPPALSTLATVLIGEDVPLGEELHTGQFGDDALRRITFSGRRKGSVEMDGSRIVWHEWDGGWKIYLYDLNWWGGLFADGFETGDTSAWSTTVP